MQIGIIKKFQNKPKKKLLSLIYPVGFTKIPTFKPKKFEEIPGVVTKDKEWDISVTMEAINMIEAGRAVLIICKTLSDTILVEKCLNISIQKTTT
jgi:hypothetical protein